MFLPIVQIRKFTAQEAEPHIQGESVSVVVMLLIPLHHQGVFPSRVTVLQDLWGIEFSGWKSLASAFA